VSCAAAALSAEAADAHRVDDVADGAHASGVAVGYFGAERLLDRHHDPDGVELVGAEIVDQVGRGVTSLLSTPSCSTSTFFTKR
jgi:hypothetical protein